MTKAMLGCLPDVGHGLNLMHQQLLNLREDEERWITRWPQADRYNRPICAKLAHSAPTMMWSSTRTPTSFNASRSSLVTA